MLGGVGKIHISGKVTRIVSTLPVLRVMADTVCKSDRHVGILSLLRRESSLAGILTTQLVTCAHVAS